jgi:hypothetical protein
MKLVLTIGGAILILAGLVWILQGLGILTAIPSFMIGRREWVWWGAASIVVGLIAVFWSRRRR